MGVAENSQFHLLVYGTGAQQCGGDFDLAKKCSVGNVDALIPGCAPGVSAALHDRARARAGEKHPLARE